MNNASTFGKKVRGTALRDCIIKLNPDFAEGKGKYFLGAPLLRNKDALLNFWISRNNTAPCGSNVDSLSAAEFDMADAGFLPSAAQVKGILFDRVVEIAVCKMAARSS